MGRGLIMVQTRKILNDDLPRQIEYVFKNLTDNKNISVYIHGSWADGTNIFFSDIDDFVIVDDSNEESYQDTIKTLTRSEIRFAHIDPLQHHGHWMVKRSDLKNYDDAFLPHYTLNDALCIKGEDKLNFKLKSELVENKIHKYLLFTLNNIHIKNQKIRRGKLNAFEIKALASSYALMPALIYQAKGLQINKKDAISKFLLENELNKGTNAFIWASEVRNNFALIKKNIVFRFFSILPFFFINYSKWYLFTRKYSPKFNVNQFDNNTKYNLDISNEFAFLCHDMIRSKVIKKYTKEECDEIVISFIDKIKINNNILSIYKFGEINDPGISDVDLMIITKNGCLKDAYLKVEGLIKTDINYSYLFLHDPILIEEQDIATFTKIHSLNNLCCVFSRHAELPIINIKNNGDDKDFIYLNWVLFLIIYTNEVINNIVGFDERQIHHLLKNIAVSLTFVLPESNYLNHIKKIRGQSLNGELTKRKIDQELIQLYDKLISASYDCFSDKVSNLAPNKFLIGRNVLFKKSKNIKILKKKKKTVYCLPEVLHKYSYDLIFNSNQSDGPKEAWQKLSIKYKKEGVPLMTVFPFSESWLREKKPHIKLQLKYTTLKIISKLPTRLFWLY